MIIINPNEYLTITTDSVAAIDYSFTYRFFDAKDNGTKLESSEGTITTIGALELFNDNAKIQEISLLSIRNTDGTLSNNVTIGRKVNGVTYSITAKMQLLSGEYAQYDISSGWKVYDAAGIQKYVGGTGPTGPTGSVSAGTTVATLGQLNFINSNNITFGLNGNSITASFSNTGGGVGGAISFSAGTQSRTLDSLVFSNSNGVSFGLTGSTITASHNGLTTQLNQAFSASGGSSSFQTLNFANSHGVTFSNSNGSIIASHNGLTSQSIQTQNTISVQGSSGAISFSNSNGVTFGGNASTITASFSQSSVVFSNSNNVSFGQAGSTITASATFSYSQSVQPHIEVSAGTESMSAGSLVFANSNNISFGLNASTITASFSQSVQPGIKTVSAGTTLITNNELVFSNSNGVSFGMSGNTITASVGAGGVTPAVSAANGSSTFQTLSFANSNGLSFSTGTQGLYGSYSVPSIAGLLSAINLSAGTTSNNLSAFTLNNSNGISFGLNGSVITASHNGLTAQSVQTQNMVSLLGSTGNISLANSNGITFGGNASTITASHNGLTSQSNQALSGSNGSFAFQTASFGNLNGMSFYTSNGSMVASYTVPATAGLLSAINLSAGTTSNNLSAFTLSNSNGLSFGLNGSVLTASHNGLTSQSVQTQNSVLVQGSSGAVSFGNANGITFGGNASTITASHNGLTSQTNQTLGLYAVSNTTLGTSMTVDARTLSFQGAGVASVGVSNGSVVISVPAGGGGGLTNINVSAGTTSNNLSNLQFANSNGVSFGLSGSTITASFSGGGGGGIGLANSQTTFTSGTVNLSAAGAMTIQSTTGQSFQLSVPNTSALSAYGNLTISSTSNTIAFSVAPHIDATLSGYNAYADLALVAHQQGNGTLQLDPDYMPNVQFDRVLIPMNFTNASNSSGSQTVSFWVGLYTRNVSSLSLYSSVSASTAVTMSGTAGSYSLFSGFRQFSIPMSATLTEGNYWIAFLSRTTSGGANASISHFAASNVNSNFIGQFGVAANTTMQFTLGQGVYSATTNAFPSSIGFSQIRGSDSAALRGAALIFAYSTV